MPALGHRYEQKKQPRWQCLQKKPEKKGQDQPRKLVTRSQRSKENEKEHVLLFNHQRSLKDKKRSPKHSTWNAKRRKRRGWWWWWFIRDESGAFHHFSDPLERSAFVLYPFSRKKLGDFGALKRYKLTEKRDCNFVDLSLSLSLSLSVSFLSFNDDVYNEVARPKRLDSEFDQRPTVWTRLFFYASYV